MTGATEKFRLSSLAKKLMLLCVIFTALAGAVLAFFRTGLPALFVGLLLGGSLSVLKVYLLERSIDKALDFDKKHGRLYAQLAFMARTFLTAGVIIAAFLLPKYIDVFGAVAGTLAMPASAYLSRIIFRNEFADAPIPQKTEQQEEPAKEADIKVVNISKAAPNGAKAYRAKRIYKIKK